MIKYKPGIDNDLQEAIEYNGNIGFTDISVDEILAVAYGEHDEENYYWVLRLHDGTVGLLQGGCDYTGWDCRSWLDWLVATTPEEAITLVDLKYEERPVQAFLQMQLHGEIHHPLSAYQVVAKRMGFPKIRGKCK